MSDDPEKPLPPPDYHHLRAAQGWLGLGNWQEAAAEFEKLSDESRVRPESTETLREIFVMAGNWDMATAVAGKIVQEWPGNADGWISYAYATRRRKGGGIEAAREILLRAHHQFSDNPLIVYNLACYECQLGNEEAAWAWFLKAITIGTWPDLCSTAIEDPDLKPLWPKIRGL